MGKSEGVLAAQENGEWFFITQYGTRLFRQAFQNVTPFWNGVAGVCVEEKWGFLTHSGTYLLPPVCSEIDMFIDSFAKVILDGRMVYVCLNGNIVEPKW